MVDLFAHCDVLVVDALRREPHPTHPHLAMTLEFIARCGARRAVLTHLDKSMDYAQLRAELPDHIEPGFDGLEIEL
jgi:phosphoribosyl 1,2-cyclic phosphate phosphodiesterase